MKEFHNLISNTTTLVGYIAVLMFVGAYFGGEKSFALDPALMKGSIFESRGVISQAPAKPLIITIDGRQYEAHISGEITKPEFQY